MGGAVLVSAFLVVVLAIGPVHNFPVEDDWDYSRMVKIFLETGRLQRSDYAQATLIFPAVYGALVSRVFGFSFTALRLSTLVLALGALLAFYALLITDPRPRQAGYAAAAGLLGVVVVRLAGRGEWFPYLTDILTRAGLRPYLAYVAWDAGALRSEILPRWVFIFATIVAAGAGLSLSFLAIRHARRLWSRSESPAQQFLFLLTLLIAGASLVFATFRETSSPVAPR